MTEKQQAAGHERVCHARDDSYGRVHREIHQNVPAEHDVVALGPPELRIRIDEIALLEGDHAADALDERERGAMLNEVALAQLTRRFAQCPRRIARELGFL